MSYREGGGEEGERERERERKGGGEGEGERDRQRERGGPNDASITSVLNKLANQCCYVHVGS